MTADEIYTTWACRSDAHEMCSGLGFRVMPDGIDLPCACDCHPTHSQAEVS